MSDYDLETANAMLLTGRYLYVGSFTIQTCGENGIGQAIVGGAVRLYRQT